jgi:hypothetical protein
MLKAATVTAVLTGRHVAIALVLKALRRSAWVLSTLALIPVLPTGRHVAIALARLAAAIRARARYRSSAAPSIGVFPSKMILSDIIH